MRTEPSTDLKSLKTLNKVSFSNIIDQQGEIAFGSYAYAAGARFGPLRGLQFEIIHVMSGQVNAICDGQEFAFKAPQFAVMVATDSLEYRYGDDGPCHIAWCQWLGADLTQDAVAKVAPLTGAMAPSSDAVSLMQMGTRAASRPDIDNSTYLSVLARALLEEFLLRNRRDLAAMAVPDPVERARAYIDTNLARPMSMAQLVKVSGISPQHLNRLFQAFCGENTLDYLWRARIRQAAFLLTHTGLRISQIAYQCGFQTPNHFSRRFGERFAESPRDYRNRRWQGHGLLRADPSDPEVGN